MNIFTVEPTSSNAAEEACQLLLLELIKKDENSLLESRNVNVNEHHSDEKVEVSELRNLITSLGKSTNGSVNTFPKPSCGKVSESSSDGEESHRPGVGNTWPRGPLRPSKGKSAAPEHLFIFNGMRPSKGNSAALETQYCGPRAC